MKILINENQSESIQIKQKLDGLRAFLSDDDNTIVNKFKAAKKFLELQQQLLKSELREDIDTEEKITELEKQKKLLLKHQQTFLKAQQQKKYMKDAPNSNVSKSVQDASNRMFNYMTSHAIYMNNSSM